MDEKCPLNNYFYTWFSLMLRMESTLILQVLFFHKMRKDHFIVCTEKSVNASFSLNYLMEKWMVKFYGKVSMTKWCHQMHFKGEKKSTLLCEVDISHRMWDDNLLPDD